MFVKTRGLLTYSVVSHHLKVFGTCAWLRRCNFVSFPSFHVTAIAKKRTKCDHAFEWQSP